MHVISERLANGDTIAESFTIKNLFPPFILRMIKVGERSGSLPEQLEYITDDYRSRLNTTVETIGNIIEPVVLVGAGGMFAIILAGLFLPIYDLVSQVGNQIISSTTEYSWRKKQLFIMLQDSPLQNYVPKTLSIVYLI